MGISQPSGADGGFHGSITYQARYTLDGITEPSGLGLSLDGESLWTVSDESGYVFEVDLQGRIKRSFSTGVTDLEGVTADPSGRLLFAVSERDNAVVKIDAAREQVVSRRPLSSMADFDKVLPYLDGVSEDNSGLEGIAFDIHRNRILVVTEANPRLLIEVTPELDRILAAERLDAERGFIHSDEDLDLSGLSYDSKRRSLWMVSDRARQLYLFDLQSRHVTRNLDLEYRKKGKDRRVKDAEGIALDPDSGHLYVVTDTGKPRLYVYRME